MDWFERIVECCVANHDPTQFAGREWDELPDEEREEEINSAIADLADSLEVQ